MATDCGADSADGHTGMVRELLSGELDSCRLGRLGDLLEYYRPLHDVSQLGLDRSSQVHIDSFPWRNWDRELVPDALAGKCGGNRHLSYVSVSVEHRCNDVSGDLALFLRYPDQPLSLTSRQCLPIRYGLRDLWHVDRVEDLASLDLENGQVVEAKSLAERMCVDDMRLSLSLQLMSQVRRIRSYPVGRPWSRERIDLRTALCSHVGLKLRLDPAPPLPDKTGEGLICAQYGGGGGI